MKLLSHKIQPLLNSILKSKEHNLKTIPSSIPLIIKRSQKDEDDSSRILLSVHRLSPTFLFHDGHRIYSFGTKQLLQEKRKRQVPNSEIEPLGHLEKKAVTWPARGRRTGCWSLVFWNWIPVLFESVFFCSFVSAGRRHFNLGVIIRVS